MSSTSGNPVRRILCRVAYDGTDFAGWQSQRGARTVQDVVERALGELCGVARHPIIGAGRTDAGVHASGQAFHFDLAEPAIPGPRWAEALNSHLPPDVRVRASGVVAENPGRDSLHARFSARRRHYSYRLSFAPQDDPLLARSCVGLGYRPDLDLLDRLLVVLEGEHDFASFGVAGTEVRSTVRRLTRAGLVPVPGGFRIDIAGTAFLRRMVRGIVGTALALERRGSGPEAMQTILDSRDRSKALQSAPPQGLNLEYVWYHGISW